MRAKRGDLVVIERKTSYVTTSSGRHEQLEYEVGVVTSITREGMVKAWKSARRDSVQAIDRTFGYLRSFVMPAAEIDVDSALEAAAANKWRSGHPGKPFDTLDEVKDCVRPFKIQASAEVDS